MKIHKILASEVACLDSNVYSGGGTDDTKALQAVLDMAKDGDGVWLVMDGASLVSQLKLYSNTTIECLSKDCGFFQIEQTNASIVTNAIWDDYELKTKNISLIGGTYNQDCKRQEHHTEDDRCWFVEGKGYEPSKKKYTIGVEFYGIENLKISGITLRNFRSFACTIGCFRNVIIENSWLDLPDHEDSMNQDGFHFWGPGSFLTVKNVGGRVGDDFMNLGPDERDKVSSITDVLVDGVFLENADQAIRLLSRDKGRLDRVTIRNVTGTYKSFGFYINPWFVDDTLGNFGNIFIENVDLKALEPNYKHRTPILFSVGGNIEALVLKNIRNHDSIDNRTLIEIGIPYIVPFQNKYLKEYGVEQNMENIIIEDLLVTEKEVDPKDTEYITVHEKVKNLVVRNAKVFKDQDENGALLSIKDNGCIETLVVEDVYMKGLKTFINDEEKIGKLTLSNVTKEEQK